MRIQRACVFFTMVSAFLLLPRSAVACGCNPFGKTALEVYEQSDLVVIARMFSVEKAATPKFGYGGDVSSATMIVDKVYKGDVKVNDELKFAQGDEVLHCAWTFYPEQKGEQYLLYLVRPEKPTDPWYISTCTRSNYANHSKADLLYLDSLEKHHRQTRVSGLLRWEGDLNVEDLKISIKGRYKTYLATVDKDGVYEIYNLPPGHYVIEPELPLGWKVDKFHLTREYKRADMYRHPSNRVSFTLEPQKHFGVDMELRLSNHLSGTVVDSNSHPLQSVCVSLTPVNDESLLACNGLTDKRGRFRINSVKAGEYVLILNYENKPTSEMPFPKLYYPGVTEHEQATIISVKHGQSVDGLKIVINQHSNVPQ